MWPTMAQAGNHRANLFPYEIKNEIHQNQNQMMVLIKIFRSSENEIQIDIHEEVEVANATTQIFI